MWRGTATPALRAAREREQELNERQIEVLRLIERGHTNREIAEMLEMSVDGAKWNVSEILTKLGLASREEAAEYWRWRKGRTAGLSRRLRALIASPVARWIGAGGLATAAVAGLVGTFGGSPPPAPLEVAPFYLEATETIVRTKETSVSQLRWWYQDSDHYRSEYERLEPWFAANTSIATADGTEFGALNTEFAEFSAGPIEPMASHQRVRPTPVIMIGPAPAPTVSGLLDVLSHWGEGSQWNNNGVLMTRPAPPAARVVGRDTLLGRPVQIIDYVQGMIWLDTADMVVLKHVSQHFTVEVTRYEEHPAMPPTLFVQPIPQGVAVRQVIPGSPVPPQSFAPSFAVSGVPAATPSVPLPGPNDAFGVNASGRFRATHLPAGYAIHEGFGAGTAGSAYGEWVGRPVDAAGNPIRDSDYVRIGQRPMDALPAVLRQGEPFTVRGHPGFLANANDGTSLSWIESGLVVHIEASAAVGFDELVRIADGLVFNP